MSQQGSGQASAKRAKRLYGRGSSALSRKQAGVLRSGKALGTRAKRKKYREEEEEEDNSEEEEEEDNSEEEEEEDNSGEEKTKKTAKPGAQGSRNTSKGSKTVADGEPREKTESNEEREKRLKAYLATYSQKNGHRVVSFAGGATIWTLPSYLAAAKRKSSSGLSQARVAFEKDLDAKPASWKNTHLFFDLHGYNLFHEPVQVVTLPGHHQGLFPLVDIVNRQVDGCGLTGALRSAMLPSVPNPEHGGDIGSLLRASIAVLDAKGKGGINCEVMSGKNAVQLYHAFNENKHAYPQERLDMHAALRAIKEKPLQIRHPIFLVSSKNADGGHYLRLDGGFPSLRALLPADLLEAIEDDYRRMEAKKALKNRGKSEGTRSTDEETEITEAAVEKEETNESDYNTSDFMFDDE
jgi:hypothetical protein